VFYHIYKDWRHLVRWIQIPSPTSTGMCGIFSSSERNASRGQR
jgi:hypothetical protein